MNIIRIAQLLKTKPVRKKSGYPEQRVLGVLDGTVKGFEGETERILTSADSRSFLWNLVKEEKELDSIRKKLEAQMEKERSRRQAKTNRAIRLAKIEAGTL
jgi:hypothetical protein